ncbi:hypothetical protein LJR289_001826 [Pseudoduganella sp. LjRoot289]|uniref:hypothetical protein n=1 Tax=Pseudoduganella sp. LjRoot289 TaxID=3342314 RepID=UPI003ECC78E5
MNSNDQSPPSGPLDFQPRRANDRVMLSRIANLEHEMAAVRTTVEIIRSNYVTKEDLAREISALAVTLNDKIDAVAGRLNGKIDTATGTLNGKIDTAAGTLNGKIDTATGTLNGKIDTAAGTLNDKIDTVAGTLNDKIVAVAGTLNDKIDTLTVTLNEKIVKANDNTHSLRTEMYQEFNKQTWRIIGFITLLCSTLTGAVYYIARYVH